MLRSALLLLLVLATPAFAGTTTWEIDPAHSGAHFAVRHLMISTVRGTLGKITGTVVLDDTDITKSRVEATVDATGIDTREAKRDDHLKGPDFFDVEKFPTITFVSKRIEPGAEGHYKVIGDLTMHGVTKEVVLDASGSTTPIQDAFGNTKLGGTVTTKLNRQDFGISYGGPGGVMIGNEVDVTIDIELIKK